MSLVPKDYNYKEVHGPGIRPIYTLNPTADIAILLIHNYTLSTISNMSRTEHEINIVPTCLLFCFLIFMTFNIT